MKLLWWKKKQANELLASGSPATQPPLRQRFGKQCPDGHGGQEFIADYCSLCGVALVPVPGHTCQQCGRLNPFAFCPHCGDPMIGEGI